MNTQEFTKCFATSVAEIPFIVIVVVIFKNLSVMTIICSFFRDVPINGRIISKNTGLCAYLAGNS